MANPFQPSLGLLVKLGSVAVHCDEVMDPGWHPFDITAIRGLLNDPEVAAWLKEMDSHGLLPKKRK